MEIKATPTRVWIRWGRWGKTGHKKRQVSCSCNKLLISVTKMDLYALRLPPLINGMSMSSLLKYAYDVETTKKLKRGKTRHTSGLYIKPRQNAFLVLNKLSCPYQVKIDILSLYFSTFLITNHLATFLNLSENQCPVLPQAHPWMKFCWWCLSALPIPILFSFFFYQHTNAPLEILIENK